MRHLGVIGVESINRVVLAFANIGGKRLSVVFESRSLTTLSVDEADELFDKWVWTGGKVWRV
jgi:hypothetical protein